MYYLKITNDDKRQRSILCKDTNLYYCLFRTGEHIYVTAYLVLVNIFRLLPIKVIAYLLLVNMFRLLPI